jgi:hypothetical protein
VRGSSNPHQLQRPEICIPSVPPKILETRWAQFSVPHRMLNVAVAEISLQRPRVVAFVGQRVAASGPEHMRVRLEGELCLPACTLDHPGKPGGAKGCPALRCEHEGRLGLLLALKPPQRPQLVPKDRMGARRALLDPTHVQGRSPEIHLLPTAGPPTRRSAGRAGRPQEPLWRPGAPNGSSWPRSSAARPRPRSGTLGCAGRRWEAV